MGHGLPYLVSIKGRRISQSPIHRSHPPSISLSAACLFFGTAPHQTSLLAARKKATRAAHTGDPRERHPHCGIMAVAAGVEPQLVGIAVATAVFLAAVLWRRRATVVEGKPVSEADCPVASDGVPAGDTGTDVIVVGAGVAGSALAYTLGKVPSFVPSLVGFRWLVEIFFRLIR
jgi:hypothetical protein